ncbi:hypothetical protein EY643_17450 [Halioglobus maricola]|uniref:Outer membrane protein beta-barrel domain-containing protein n=1 Tax=Halioglobus maricola TaxID=2601894 RepID=A0A5P9NNB4_9GAMM|nr:hypothetical protein [Halioglobus maricola]QFU77301.1 hypothetical protein EY643_17450 [Halioglobus maricola]
MLRLPYKNYWTSGICLPATVLACIAGSQQAVGNPISDTHIFRVGAYEQDIDVAASATRGGAPEVEIDFDKALGLDDSATTLFFQYQWRFKENWTLSAFYTNMSADGSNTAGRDFNWDGVDYKAGARLDTEFGVDTYLIAVDYSFIKTDKLDIGAGFGLHAFEIETDIEAEVGIVEDGNTDDSIRGRVARNTTELLAPLPNIRGFARYMITPKWAVLGSLGWLSANYEDYDGDYLFLTALTEYRFTENFGIGASYQISEIDVTNDNGNRKRAFDIDQYGPSIYLTYGF